MTAGIVDLRAAARALMPSLPDPAHRAAAVATWRGRMVNEFSSAPVFTGLAAQLEAAGAPGWAAEAAEMAGEEHRHGALCGAVVEALGAEAVAPAPARDPLPEHLAVDRFEAVTRNLLSVCCLSETVACALITAERAEMPEGPLRALLGEILADEVGHARLGWRWLAAHTERLADPALRARLGAWLRVAFAHLEVHELANLVPGSPTDPALGLCDAHAARALFRQTVEQVIVPRLEAHRLPAAQAWRDRAAG